MGLPKKEHLLAQIVRQQKPTAPPQKPHFLNLLLGRASQYLVRASTVIGFSQQSTLNTKPKIPTFLYFLYYAGPSQHLVRASQGVGFIQQAYSDRATTCLLFSNQSPDILLAKTSDAISTYASKPQHVVGVPYSTNNFDGCILVNSVYISDVP